jgi:hypothetical protein
MIYKPVFVSGHAPSISSGAVRALPVAAASSTQSAARTLVERTRAEIGAGFTAVETAISIYGGDEFDDLRPSATSPSRGGRPMRSLAA